MNKLRFETLLVFSLAASLISCSDERETVTVKKNDIVEAVYSSVVLEPANMYSVNASVSGYIDDIPVAAGDNVAMDDVLFVIRDVQSNATASNAKLAYDMAKRNYAGDLSLLEDLKLEIANAALKRSNDSINYARNKKLYAENVITQVEFEQAQLIFNSSKNGHNSLINKYNRSQKELQSNLSQAKNTYLASQSRSDDAVIRTKVDGVVFDLMKEPGEFVTIQQPIAVVGSDDRFTIKMLIDEVDITKVKKGQKIIVSLEAYKNKTFEAKVTHISPKMDERTQTFELEGEFINPPKKLYMGLTGEANIIISERSAVVVIPVSFLVDENHVETADGNVKVKLGVRSLSHVEVLEGLKEGDVIYKPEE